MRWRELRTWGQQEEEETCRLVLVCNCDHALHSGLFFKGGNFHNFLSAYENFVCKLVLASCTMIHEEICPPILMYSYKKIDCIVNSSTSPPSHVSCLVICITHRCISTLFLKGQVNLLLLGFHIIIIF